MRFQVETESIPRIVDGDVRVEVSGRYEPDTIVMRAGHPLRLTFNRHESWPCSDRVVFPDFDLEVDLPSHEDVIVELDIPGPGEYEFTCGRGVLRGRVIVEAA